MTFGATTSVRLGRMNQAIRKVGVATAVIALLLQNSCVGPGPSPPTGGLRSDLSFVALPPWITADFARFIGEFESFTAHLEVQTAEVSAPDSIRTRAGILLGQNGNLLFIPESKGRRRGGSGEMILLWNGPSKTGFVVCEPMQAYAPAPPPNAASNNITVLAADGPKPSSVKARFANDSSEVTLLISRINYKPIPPDQFTIPDGFTRYASVEAMMAELMARQSSMRRKGMGAMPVRMPNGPDRIQGPGK